MDEGSERQADEEVAAVEVLHSQLRAVARLANMDGCVVLDRELNLVGFGGIIQAQEGCESSRLVLRDRTGRAIDESASLALRGTRHKSAFQLCKALPNSLAFVVSQDGDLRVFSSDNESVYFEEHLYP